MLMALVPNIKYAVLGFIVIRARQRGGEVVDSCCSSAHCALHIIPVYLRMTHIFHHSNICGDLEREKGFLVSSRKESRHFLG